MIAHMQTLRKGVSFLGTPFDTQRKISLSTQLLCESKYRSISGKEVYFNISLPKRTIIYYIYIILYFNKGVKLEHY